MAAMQQLDCSNLNTDKRVVEGHTNDDDSVTECHVDINNNNNNLWNCQSDNVMPNNLDENTLQPIVATCSVIHLNMSGHRKSNVTNIRIGEGDHHQKCANIHSNLSSTFRPQSTRSLLRQPPDRFSNLFAGNARHPPNSLSSSSSPSSSSASTSTSSTSTSMVQFVCSATEKSPATFKICGNHLFATKYQESLLNVPIGFFGPDPSCQRPQSRLALQTRATIRKVGQTLQGQLKPMEFMRLILIFYLLVDITLNILFLFCIEELNELFMQRIRTNFGVNPFDCTSLQARVGLSIVLFVASTLDVLSLCGLVSQNLWLNLLNVCQITFNLLKICFLYDSVCIFLVHLLFVFIAIIYTSLLLPINFPLI